MKKQNNFPKLITVLLIGLLNLSLLAAEGSDERTTLLKQANHFTIRRNYEKANSIYKKLLEEDQSDYVVATKLIQNYFKTSQIDAAEELIDKYREIFPKLTLLRMNTVLRIRRGKSEVAFQEVQAYLNSNAKNINRYRELASLFQANKEYNYAVQLFLEARKVTNDESLYARELAINYRYLGEYENAISEYLKYLRKNSSYRHFVFNRIKDMLDQDPSLVQVLEEEYKSHDNAQISEVYAKSLAFVEEYETALQVYTELDANLLRVFAENQYKNGNYQLALEALQKYIQRESSPIKIADAKLLLADIYIDKKKTAEAKKILLQIYNNKQLQNRRNFYRSHANKRCREKLAELAMKSKADNQKVINYYQEAGKFAMNEQEKRMIDLQITDYLMMTGEFDMASKKLERVKKTTEVGTEVDKLSNYYAFMLAFMQNKETADSLLTEVMINIPQNRQVNDLLLLKEVMKDLRDTSQKQILRAYRQKNIYNYNDAMLILDSLKTDGKQENIRVLQGMWALENNDDEARKYFAGEFEDPIMGTIASYFNTVLEKDGQIRSLLASDFLKNNSEAVFAPQFREFLR